MPLDLLLKEGKIIGRVKGKVLKRIPKKRSRGKVTVTIVINLQIAYLHCIAAQKQDLASCYDAFLVMEECNPQAHQNSDQSSSDRKEREKLHFGVGKGSLMKK